MRWVEPGAEATVALVQGDILQDVKWRPESVDENLDRYRQLSAPYWRRDLVIWPEAAVTLFEQQAMPFIEEMARHANHGGAALVFGVPGYERLPDGSVEFRNMAAVVGDGEGHYIKRRLVPFGEYVPLEGLLRGAIEFFDLPMSHAVPGPAEQPLLRAGQFRLAMAICYEIVYPDLVRRDARAADVIVTLSNDSWFGRSIGPHQHLQMARMRALENGRYVLRATNNGITAIVDSAGSDRRAGAAICADCARRPLRRDVGNDAVRRARRRPGARAARARTRDSAHFRSVVRRSERTLQPAATRRLGVCGRLD